MHAPHGPFVAIEADVGLRDHRIQSVGLELPLTERAREESSLVLTPLEIHHESALQFGFAEDHSPCLG